MVPIENPSQPLDVEEVIAKHRSTQVKHFILPEGRYKIRMEQIASGLDEMRPVDVVFGRVTPVRIDVQVQEEEQSPTAQP